MAAGSKLLRPSDLGPFVSGAQALSRDARFLSHVL